MRNVCSEAEVRNKYLSRGVRLWCQLLFLRRRWKVGNRIVYLAFSNQTHIFSFSWLFLETPCLDTHVHRMTTLPNTATRKEWLWEPARGSKTFVKHQLNYIMRLGIPRIPGQRRNIVPRPHLNDRWQHVIKIHNKYVIMKLVLILSAPFIRAPPPLLRVVIMISNTTSHQMSQNLLRTTKELRSGYSFWLNTSKVWHSIRAKT